MKKIEPSVEHTLSDLRRAKAGLNQDIAALGTESSGHGLGQSVNTSQKRSTALNAKLQLLFSEHSSATNSTIAQFVISIKKESNKPCGRSEAAGRDQRQLGTWRQRPTEP